MNVQKMSHKYLCKAFDVNTIIMLQEVKPVFEQKNLILQSYFLLGIIDLELFRRFDLRDLL